MARRSLIAIALVASGTPSSAVRADDTLSVAAPGELVGDGRAVAIVTVTAGPIATRGKLLPVADVARVTCREASALPAVHDLPAVLAPAVTSRTSLSCTARFHELEAPFQIRVRPPPPGLYAAAKTIDIRSTTKEITIEAFDWDGKRRQRASNLRAASSEGRIAARDGSLALTVGGNAPRLVAIALSDGNHVGAAFVPVTGVTTLPVESEPRASVQCWVAGRWFGPVKTKGRRASIPIEVPPGITHGVVRSTGRAGYITDAVTDLKIPARQRIAALITRDDIHVGDRVTIAVAIAGSDGRPAEPTTTLSATARRGTLGPAKSLGNGLWTVPYTAPAQAGPDHVSIRIDGDRSAGTAEVDLAVAAGTVSRIELVVPPGPYEPGADIAATARVFDAAGNPVHDPSLTATVAGTPAVVTRGEPLAIRGRIPEHLPDGDLLVEVTSGGVRKQVRIEAAGVAVAARADAIVDGRSAGIELAVRDRFGNLVPERSFEVAVTGGSLRALVRNGHAFHATIAADPASAHARLVVRAHGQVLLEQQVRFEPPARAFVLGAWACGGWIDNLGVLAGPRGSAGLALRRGVGGLELAVLAGFDGVRFRDSTQIAIDGMMVDAQRSIVGLGGLLAIRARARLSRRFGVAVGVGLVPVRARVKLDGGPQLTETYSEAVLGLRAQVQADTRFGPGRLYLGGAYGKATLSEGVVIGRIDGAAILAGYEWWFADFGW